MTRNTALQDIPPREILFRFVDLLLLVLGNWLAYVLVLQLLPAAETDTHMTRAFLVSVVMYAVFSEGFRKHSPLSRFARLAAYGIVLSVAIAVTRALVG